MGKLRERLSFANVVSVIALVAALGLGTAWAATELEKNDVTSKIIKNGAVKGKDLANEAVTSSKVDDGSLLGEDFAAGQLQQGPEGPQGKAGQDASNLFAYILDNGDGVAANVAYGDGVTGVTETGFAGEYHVTFNRSVANCAAQATSGNGDPVGGGNAAHSTAAIYMQTGPAETIEVVFQNAAGNDVDTSFLISAFC
jgi:hypothetical protein